MGFLHPLYLNRLAEIAQDYVKKGKEHELRYEPMNHYPFFSVVGVGMGYHLEYLAQQDIGHLYIYEPNEDLFYASMFTTDWQWLVEQFTKENRSITILVGVSFDKYLEGFQKLFHKFGLFKAGCLPVYQHYASEESDEIMKNFFKNVVAIYGGFGFFEDEILSVRNTLANIKLKPNFLPENLIINEELRPRVFVCGSGPSIDEAIDFVKENQDKAVVVSCGTALKVFHKAGIVPDFHIEVERTKGVKDFLDTIDDPEYFSKITLIAMQNVMSTVVAKFGQTLLYLKPNDGGTDLIRVTHPKNNIAHLFGSNPTVTNSAVAVCNYLNAKEVYLFGVDLGYKDPNQHHSKDSAYYNELKEKVNHARYRSKKTAEANFGGKVFVNHVFDWARTSMEYALRRQEDSGDCFNCSDGAKIVGAIPTKIADINFEYEFDKDYFVGLIKSLNYPSTVKYDNLVSSLRKRGKVLCDMIDYFVDDRFLEVELTPKNVIEIMNRNYMHLMTHNGSEDIFGMRMATGSLTYIQIAILGFLYTVRSSELRTEFGKDGLRLLHEYLSEMKFMFKNEFLPEEK